LGMNGPAGDGSDNFEPPGQVLDRRSGGGVGALGPGWRSLRRPSGHECLFVLSALAAVAVATDDSDLVYISSDCSDARVAPDFGETVDAVARAIRQPAQKLAQLITHGRASQ
jgi:hypothetical protein